MNIPSTESISMMTKKATIFEVSPKVKKKNQIIDHCSIINHPPSSSKPEWNKWINYWISFTSRTDNYVLFNDTKPGDIVIATPYNIKHHSYVKERYVNNNYLISGVVKNFCYLEGDGFNVAKKLEVQWIAVRGC